MGKLLGLLAPVGFLYHIIKIFAHICLYIFTRLSGRFLYIFYFNCDYFLFLCIVKQKQNKSLRIFKKIVDFHNLQKSNFVRGKNLKIQSSIKLLWGHVRSNKKFGPVRYSRFDVYWIQTNKHPNRPRQTSQIYIQNERN